MKSIKKTLSATTLRILLFVALALAIIITAIGFYFTQNMLLTYATQVSEKVAEAGNSNNKIQTLQRVEQQLKTQSEAAERAANVVAESQSYLYQDQIIKDLSTYATEAGVQISEFNFATGSATPKSGANAATPAPVPEVGGVKSTSVEVTLKPIENYPNLLRFIRSIEQNLTKMQIARVNLTRISEGNASFVSAENFTIEVYVR